MMSFICVSDSAWGCEQRLAGPSEGCWSPAARAPWAQSRRLLRDETSRAAVLAGALVVRVEGCHEEVAARVVVLDDHHLAALGDGRLGLAGPADEPHRVTGLVHHPHLAELA